MIIPNPSRSCLTVYTHCADHCHHAVYTGYPVRMVADTDLEALALEFPAWRFAENFIRTGHDEKRYIYGRRLSDHVLVGAPSAALLREKIIREDKSLTCNDAG